MADVLTEFGLPLAVLIVFVFVRVLMAEHERVKRYRREVDMPRWGERIDLLSQVIECGHSDIADAYACDICTPRPIRDPYKRIRATASQGMARPTWVSGKPR